MLYNIAHCLKCNSLTFLLLGRPLQLIIDASRMIQTVSMLGKDVLYSSVLAQMCLNDLCSLLILDNAKTHQKGQRLSA